MEYEFSSSPFRKGQIGNVTLRQRLVADPEGVGAVSGQPAYEGPGQQGGPDDSGVYDEGHTVMKKRRNRAKLSCAECRRLKLKCQREPWPCASCVKRGCDHLCPDGVMPASSRASRARDAREIDSLTRKVATLEAQLKARGGDIGDSATGSPAEGLEPGRYSGLAPTDTPDESQQAGNDGVLIDTIGSLAIAGEDRTRFLGPAHAKAYTSEGSDEESEDSAEEEEDLLAYSHSFPLTSHRASHAELASLLPARPEAVRLADIYFDTCSHYSEPVQRTVFQSYYLPTAFGSSLQRLHSKALELRAVDLHRLSVVFVVIALGSFFDVTRPPRPPEATTYFKAAQACLTSSNFIAAPTMASVQALQLMSAFYFNSHKKSGEIVWHIHGLMMRAVVSLGLHRDGALFGIEDPLLDQRRACFYEALLSDHQQALILGRPYAIHQDHFDTQLPSGAGLRWSNPAANPDGEAGTFHYSKWKLIPIMRKIAELGLIKSVPYDSVRLLDSKLARFVDELPQDLRPQTYARTPDGLRPICSRVTMQAHHCAVLVNESLLNLHRRHYTEALAATREEPLLSPYADSILAISLQACTIIPEVVEAAHEMYPRLAKRLAFLNLHVFGSGVCQATLVIRAPSSLLAPHAMAVLTKALSLLDAASTESQFAAELSVRLRKLHSQASQVFQSPSFRGPDRQTPVTLPSRIAEKLAFLNPTLALGINKASPQSAVQNSPPEVHSSPGLMPPMFSFWSNLDPASWSVPANPHFRSAPLTGTSSVGSYPGSTRPPSGAPTPSGTDSTQNSVPFQTPEQAWWAPSQGPDPFFSNSSTPFYDQILSDLWASNPNSNPTQSIGSSAPPPTSSIPQWQQPQ